MTPPAWLRNPLSHKNFSLSRSIPYAAVCLSFFVFPTTSPSSENQKISPARAAAYSKSHGGTGLLILQNGSPLLEESSAGLTPHSPWPVFSITKFLSVLAGKTAEKEGLLSFSDPVSKFLPSWNDHDATLSDLVNFSAGAPSGGPIFYRKNLKNKDSQARAIRPQEPRAHSFAYGPGGYEIFGTILASQLEKKKTPPLEWLQKKVLSPFGASTSGWRLDGNGSPYYSTGANLSLRQLGKLGLLLLADGREGFSRRLPPGILRDCAKNNPDFPIFYQGVWRNLAAASPSSHEVSIEKSIGSKTSFRWWQTACLSHAAPTDLLALVGSGGQRLYLVPSRNLVVARIGKPGAGFEDSLFLKSLFSTR